jgi:hypothetical protein
VLDDSRWVVEAGKAPGSVEVDSDVKAAERARWKGGVHAEYDGSGQRLIRAGGAREGQRGSEHRGDA